MNPNEIYNSLLDKGIYLASSRTFYRILKEFNAIYHRTEERKGNSKKKPDELKATAANQVWMWDITWLKTDVRGIYYYAYVIEDLYDRSSGWMPPHPAFFVKKSVYEKYGLFRLDCGINAGYELMLRFLGVF